MSVWISGKRRKKATRPKNIEINKTVKQHTLRTREWTKRQSEKKNLCAFLSCSRYCCWFFLLSSTATHSLSLHLLRSQCILTDSCIKCVRLYTTYISVLHLLLVFFCCYTHTKESLVVVARCFAFATQSNVSRNVEIFLVFLFPKVTT